MDELFLLRLPVILISLTIHEYAHAYVAYIKGDDTAALSGRLTLNPLPHLDLLGTLMILGGPFGWAKPVPVNPNRLEHPRADSGWVAFAGPLSNIGLAIIGGLILRFSYFSFIGNMDIPHYRYTLYFLLLFFQLNLGLAVFNLLPFAPLDGSHIVRSLLPYHKLVKWEEISKNAPYILYGLLIIEWLVPGVPLFTMLIVKPIFTPWYYLWSNIILGPTIASLLT